MAHSPVDKLTENISNIIMKLSVHYANEVKKQTIVPPSEYD